jgi:hypothetical protein
VVSGEDDDTLPLLLPDIVSRLCPVSPQPGAHVVLISEEYPSLPVRFNFLEVLTFRTLNHFFTRFS